jgi:NADH dehydrogenase
MPDLVSARIRPRHITFPLEPFCHSHNAEFIQAEVTGISIKNNKVETSKGTIEADFLVICLGCETNYYGNENMMNRATGLKSIMEGTHIRHQAKSVIMNRHSTLDGKGHIIIVGGGYTGFEVASHIAQYTHACTQIPFKKLPGEIQISIVEKSPVVLGNTTPMVQLWAERLIRGYGVDVKTGLTAVSFESGRNVRMSDGSLLMDTMVIWTAGVAPGEVIKILDTPKVKGGRLKVDHFLRLSGYDRVYAGGDVAGAIPPGHSQPLRMAWYFSRKAGESVAENIIRYIKNKPLKTYDPWDPGYVIPLAPGHAVGMVFGHEFHGRIPFFLHYLLSVYNSFGKDNKKDVFKDLWSEMVMKSMGM